MKAICIDARPKHTSNADAYRIKEGVIYEVRQCREYDDQWFLPELEQGYEKWRFILLSEIDELEHSYQNKCTII